MSARPTGVTMSATLRTQSQSERFDMPRWQKGQSGNPAGRPRGSRNKTTIIAEMLFNENAVAVTAEIEEWLKRVEKKRKRDGTQRAPAQDPEKVERPARGRQRQ